LLHDADFRSVRREHLIEVGKRVRLKNNIRELSTLLAGIAGHDFSFYVVSAAPQEVIQSALKGIVPENHIFGTRFQYDSSTGRVLGIDCVPAGYGKVAVLETLRAELPVSHDRVVYVGDGSSDIHVMLHVNRLDGLTIAVSENKYINQIARRTILSDDALSVLVPILEEIAGWNSTRIRSLFEAHGFVLREWDKVQTDTVTICRTAAPASMGQVV
jgi:phosphoserine phosphatase